MQPSLLSMSKMLDYLAVWQPSLLNAPACTHKTSISKRAWGGGSWATVDRLLLHHVCYELSCYYCERGGERGSLCDFCAVGEVAALLLALLLQLLHRLFPLRLQMPLKILLGREDQSRIAARARSEPLVEVR